MCLRGAGFGHVSEDAVARKASFPDEATWPIPLGPLTFIALHCYSMQQVEESGTDSNIMALKRPALSAAAVTKVCFVRGRSRPLRQYAKRWSRFEGLLALADS